MSAISVNKNNFNQEVLNSDKPVLMDFSFRSGETDHGSGKTGPER